MNLIEELGLEKCKAIVGGANELDFAYDLIVQEYLRSGDIQDGYSIDHYENCIVIDDLCTAIANHNTDHCTDIRNHISPLTEVIER